MCRWQVNRLEFGRAEPSRYHRIAHVPAAIEALFVDVSLDAYRAAPGRIVLDLDATDDPIHGYQEGRFFHGYDDGYCYCYCYCYLPLSLFCGRHLLASKLRPSNIGGAAGAREEVARIVGQVRRRWPCVRILLRAEGGFCRETLMARCAVNRVDFLFGPPRNARLVAEITGELAAAEAQSRMTGRPGGSGSPVPCSQTRSADETDNASRHAPQKTLPHPAVTHSLDRKTGKQGASPTSTVSRNSIQTTEPGSYLSVRSAG